MASSSTIKTSLTFFLIFLPLLTKQDFIPPILSPFFDNICNDVECGKGICEKAIGQPFNFVCNCEAGWKRLSEGDETNLQFLPCIISDCSLDYSCTPETPPAPTVQYNYSITDHNICNDVECGKGICEKAIGQPFNFVCNCEAGWNRLREGDETNLQFLPCIIPKCTLDYSCMPASPAPAIPYNYSFFDPCYWMYCGEGTCIKNSTYTHTCQCNPGYSNLLDFPAYPCYGQCSLGIDCANLGIKVDKSSSSTISTMPNLFNSEINSNPAISLFPGKLQWMGFILIFCAVLIRN